MKRIICLMTLATLASGYFATAQSKRYFTANGRSVSVDVFNKGVDEMMNKTGVPGMSLAIIDNNEIVYYNTYGIKQVGQRDEVNKHTVFDGCSLSKSLLVFVVYQLVDEGRFDLDKPMHQYLEYGRLSHDSRYKRITPRMVLSHCSGIENWQRMNNRDTLEILSEPGEQFVYSGEGYEYLAKIVEKILGEPYEKYIDGRVLKPLRLKNTYLKYQEKKNFLRRSSPWNYATGHEAVGRQRTFKNSNVLPAAGNHFTAEDYAKLVLAIFDGKHLSKDRINEILAPQIRVHNSALFYGPGFEVMGKSNDIIVAHGGDKPGYKNLVVYSPVNGRGLVFMCNSDRGKLLASQLYQMSFDLNLDAYVKSLYYMDDQYPSPTVNLLSVYDTQGSEAMFAEVRDARDNGELNYNTLNVLADFFRFGGGDKQIAVSLLTENTTFYPDSALSYCLLGELYLELNDYQSSLTNLLKAKELKFSRWNIDKEIKEATLGIAEAERRSQFSVDITDSVDATVQAENYNSMSGIRVSTTGDAGGGEVVGYTDKGDWLDYKVNVMTPGFYKVTFRVASLPGGGNIEIRLGSTTLVTTVVESTKAWENWVSLTKDIDLPGGSHTLRVHLNAGGLNINWLKFAYQNVSETSSR